MKVEKFNISEYEAVNELWRRAGLSAGLSDTRQEITRFQEYNPDTCLVGRDESNNSIIAVCFGGFDGRRGFIHRLVVDPVKQNQGYGKQILKAVIDRFRKNGVVKLHLLLEKGNPQAKIFYRNMGWEKRDDIILISLPLRTR